MLLAIRTAGALLAAVLLAGWGGCGTTSSTQPPDSPADTRGVVMRKSAGAHGPELLVEERPEAQSGGKFVVRVTGETRVLRRAAGGEVRRAEMQEVQPGDRVEVWFQGPVLESYPAQGTAGAMLILPRG